MPPIVVLHPWRESPKGELTLVLLPEEPELRLAFLPEHTSTEPGAEVEPENLLGTFTLHQSPDDRVPAVAEQVARILMEHKPAWLEKRLLELLNNIHGFGTSRNPRGPGGKMGMDHPLAPLGLWGPSIEKVSREVRKGRFETWEQMEARLEPMVTQPMQEAIPQVLRDDILGVSQPKMLLREPL